MNRSNIEHFVGVILLALLFRYLYWPIALSICVPLFELYQAMEDRKARLRLNWKLPWYSWFMQLDTWIDMIAGWLAIYIIWRVIL